MKWLKALRVTDKSSLNDDDIAADNSSINTRNYVITGSILFVILLLWGVFYILTRPAVITTVTKAPEFAAVLTPDFGIKDTQSALQSQQLEVSQLKSSLDSITQNNLALETKLDDTMAKLSDMLSRAQIRSENRLNNVLDGLETQMQEQVAELEQRAAQFTSNSNKNPFGTYPSTYPEQGAAQGNVADGKMLTPAPLSPVGIQTFSYQYPDTDIKIPYKRTSKNYVPTGSFVTAVLTGAADANAGVNAQGDTAPIVFRTIHDGILPNGKRSRLKGCTVTASVYGEISSNRGIARLDNLSCIFDDKEKGEEILDIPVQGTAFNFGRNGIRGTPIMRNGKIMQMAGIAGLFTGLGETAKNASSTQVTSPSGVVSSIDPSQAFLNMGGSALENVGSKMADYYIKLAEQYHSIIELNPGAVVNLVFLKGFPLDADKLADYEAKLYGESTPQDMTQTLMSTYFNPMGTMGNMAQGAIPTPPTQVINPLLNQLPPALREQAMSQYNSQQQTNPF